MSVKGIFLAAIAAVGFAAPALAQPEYDETGWRAATGEEQGLRKAFESGKGTWSNKRDGEAEKYQCMIAWAIWADTARNTGDAIPTISGDLSHAFAEGQLSHYANTLYAAEGRNAESFATKMVKEAARIDITVPMDDDKAFYKFMGKCFVHPSSWNFTEGVTLTGPQFLREFLQMEDIRIAYPPYVKDVTARDTFDQLILQKDFAAAANWGAELHGTGRKSTVYWHEVLAASELAVSSGRGLALSDPLLQTLSKVWWPKWKRGWASNLLRAKRGEYSPTPGSGSTVPLYDPGKEPGWAKQERERYYAGQTNYTPCNVWNTMGC